MGWNLSRITISYVSFACARNAGILPPLRHCSGLVEVGCWTLAVWPRGIDFCGDVDKYFRNVLIDLYVNGGADRAYKLSPRKGEDRDCSSPETSASYRTIQAHLRPSTCNSS